MENNLQKIPLDLDDYRTLVRLENGFEAPDTRPQTDIEKTLIVEELVSYLQSELPKDQSGADGDIFSNSYEEKRRLLRSLLTIRGPDPLPSWFYNKIDSLLQREIMETNLIEAIELPKIKMVFPKTGFESSERCALWQGDITKLCVDAIVNAANSEMLGCFIPFHSCIDNIIHSWAGPRVREDCHNIIQRQGFPEGTGWGKVTRAYNLPSKYILHTVGPIIRQTNGTVLPEEENQLASCYSACLDLASRVPGISSISFCCISTGVFGFPQEPAARIALKTVDQWLKNHPGALDIVIFNVFRNEDLEIYNRLLRNW